MKDFLKKILKAEIPERLLAIGAMLAAVLLLLPVVKLMKYSTPWFDDYGYGRFAKSFWNEGHTLGKLMAGVFYTVKTQYECWQGTFSSIFMMALVPIFWGEQYYKVGLWVIFAVFCLGSALLTKTAAKNILKARFSEQLILSAIITATMVELMYSVQQGLYWYNSAVHYTFMHGCLFLLLAAVLKIFYTNKLWKQILFLLLAALLGFVCGGSNYVTALLGLIFLISLLIIGFWAKKKREGLMLLLPFLIYAAAFYINISAPGNAVRGGNYQGYGPITAILQSFLYALTHLWEYTGFITLLILLLTAPFLWNLVRKTAFSFRFPALVSLYSFCIYAAGFTPGYYAMGTPGVSRMWNVIKFTLQLLLFVNETYWLGWLARKRERRTEVKRAPYLWEIFAVFAVGAWLCFYFEPVKLLHYPTWGALYYLRSTEAAIYTSEYLERLRIIKEGEGADVVVLPYSIRPGYLCKGELSTDPEAFTNTFMATYYGLRSLRIEEPQE